MKKAFTLLELEFMVVVAIIGLFAAMLLPALHKAHEKEEAKRAKQVQNFEQYRWITVGTKVKIDVVNLDGLVKGVETNNVERPQVTVLYVDKAGAAHTEVFDGKMLSPSF